MTINLRSKLKECEPYFIQYELLPKLYFKEDKEEIEYWTFFYYFVRQLNYRAIGVRLGFDYSTIAYKLNKILTTNNTIIREFIFQQISKKH